MPEQPLTTAASEANAPRPSRLSWVRRSFSFRGSVVAILVLLLLIPLGMVQDLIRERADRKSEAEMEISRTWGGAQTLLGPVIDVPYDVPVQVLAADGAHTVTRLETRYMHFLPEDLEMNALLEPHEKRRGIYSVALYGSTTTIKGSFAPISSQRTESAWRWVLPICAVLSSRSPCTLVVARSNSSQGFRTKSWPPTVLVPPFQ
jgi:inner membrane protein